MDSRRSKLESRTNCSARSRMSALLAQQGHAKARVAVGACVQVKVDTLGKVAAAHGHRAGGAQVHAHGAGG